MAIVFISPQARQRTFLKMVVLIVVGILVLGILIFFITFIFNQSSGAIPIGPSNQPKISINLDIMNSQKVKSLEPFLDLQTTFGYVVKDEAGKIIEGTISASTKEQAAKSLEESGFTIVSLEQVKVGRIKPFEAY